MVDSSYLNKERSNWRVLAKKGNGTLGSKRWQERRGNLLTSWGKLIATEEILLHAVR